MSAKLTGGQVVDLMDRIKAEVPLVDGRGLLRSVLEWFDACTVEGASKRAYQFPFLDLTPDDRDALRKAFNDAARPPLPVVRQAPVEEMSVEAARAIYTPGPRQAQPVLPDTAKHAFAPERENPAPPVMSEDELAAVTQDQAIASVAPTVLASGPDVVRRTWTAERDAKLIKLWNGGYSFAVISRQMDSSQKGVEQRIYRLREQGAVTKRPIGFQTIKTDPPAPSESAPAQPVSRLLQPVAEPLPAHGTVGQKLGWPQAASEPPKPAATPAPQPRTFIQPVTGSDHHPERLTQAEMQAIVDALEPVDEGWRTADDIAIIEATIIGDGAGKVAIDLGVSKVLVLGRLRQIVPKASPENYETALRCLRIRAAREARAQA